jgi:hypothetical protein
MSILWPVEVWTFLAPKTERQLNVFQDAVLGLLSAGVRDLNKLADMLSLERDLVAFILAKELQPRGLVDAQIRITERGESLLTGKSDDQSRLSEHYAFRDSLFGSWLPRVCTELPDIYPLEGVTGKYPIFADSRNNGRSIKPFSLPRLIKVGLGSKSDVLDAWRSCLKDANAVNHELDGIAPELMGDEIEILGDGPTLAYVICEIFHKPGDLQPWLVSDPWRITKAAKWLRKPLQAHLHALPALAQRIIGVMPDATPGQLSAADWLAQLEQKVELELLSRPSLAKPEYALIREHLARSLRQRERLAGQEGANPEELGSLIQECGSLLEALVQWMLERWQVTNQFWPPDGVNRRVAYDLLAQLPLKSDLPEHVKKILAGQNFKEIRLAAIKRDRPFKALLFAALLSTHHHDDHPLKQLDSNLLDWDRLLALIDMRNKGVHASGRKLVASQAIVEADFAINWFEKFSPYF